MTKKILAVAMAALLMLSAMSMSVFATDAVAETTAAETEPVEEVKDEVLDYIDADAADAAEKAVYDNMNDAYVYIKFGADKANDGLTPDTPKPNLGAADGDGSAGVLAQTNGGTLVATGKLYVGATYSFPEYENTLMITSNDGTTDYKNAEPATNPSCAMKIKQNATCTFVSDTIIDDIILFNEFDNSSTTIAITNNSTLVIGENIVSMNNEANADYAIPCHVSLYVEDGSTLIVRGGTFDTITGGGNVYIADTVTVEEKVREVKTDENGMIIPDPDVVITRPVLETEAPETTEAVAETTEAPAATSEGGISPVVIVVVIVAVVAVVAVVVVVTKKKK
ncbi:MAG: hypothetical protein IJ002_06625 [Clostridia bacterium]|nr:hypothetical protein [Clostridia bacterium]